MIWRPVAWRWGDRPVSKQVPPRGQLILKTSGHPLSPTSPLQENPVPSTCKTDPESVLLSPPHPNQPVSASAALLNSRTPHQPPAVPRPCSLCPASQTHPSQSRLCSAHSHPCSCLTQRRAQVLTATTRPIRICPHGPLSTHRAAPAWNALPQMSAGSPVTSSKHAQMSPSPRGHPDLPVFKAAPTTPPPISFPTPFGAHTPTTPVSGHGLRQGRAGCWCWSPMCPECPGHCLPHKKTTRHLTDAFRARAGWLGRAADPERKAVRGPAWGTQGQRRMCRQRDSLSK